MTTMDHQFRLSDVKLLIVLGIPCFLLIFTVLASGVATSELDPTTIAPTEVNSLPCQPDSALNALLIQMLMALQPHLLFQQQPRWPTVYQERANNELQAPTPEPIVTTVVTSSVVSTLTQTLSKIISIWYRNERIPTTLYSQTTTLMTDYITITSTLRGSVEPTERVRTRRELKDDAPLLDSSLSEEYRVEYETRPIQVEPTFIRSSEELHHLIAQPRVVAAWKNFLFALEEAHNSDNGDKS